MHRFVTHLLFPVIMTVAFSAVAFTPVAVLGCRTRGLLALTIALTSGVSGLGTAAIGLRKRFRAEPDSAWWMASTALLAIPVAAMIVLA